MKQNIDGRAYRPGTPSPGAQLRPGKWGGWAWQAEAASSKLLVGCPSWSPRVLQTERGPVFSAEVPEGWYTASDGQESRARLSAMLPMAQINRTWVHPSTALQSGDVWNHSRIPRPPLSTCPGPGTHVWTSSFHPHKGGEHCHELGFADGETGSQRRSCPRSHLREAARKD